ncbi:MAG TPA: hypothetical protein VMV49_03735 [Candidatus Deferrimicrobium sp.]|nr:hypothetical protein [Candidatus Deferrimicrobium sp.]
MIYWALLLHIYQPPFQTLDILQKVNEECYSKLFDVFLRFPSSKLTLNINGSLTELLYQYKFQDVIDKIKELAQKGYLRFTGSGKYHPIFPLLPTNESIRQIHLNEDYNESIFGPLFANSKGFFPPELAISENLLKIIENLHYRWILASGIACPSQWPTDFYYAYNSLPVLFRDDIISNEISFKQYGPLKFVSKLLHLFDDDYYVITAMDGETFGHHIKNYEEEFLAAVLTQLEEEDDIQMVFIDDILKLFKEKKKIIPINSTWSTSPENLKKKNPYPLWADPKNEIHQIQNRLQKITIQLYQYLEENAPKIPNDHLEFYNNARLNLDKGEHSCRLWWASNYNFNEDLVVRGTQFLLLSTVNAYKTLFAIPLSQNKIIEIRHLFEDFKGNYANLLQLLANKTEERSRFKSYRRKIDDLSE